MIILEQRDPELVPTSAGCAALDVSRATLYRSRKPRCV